MSLGREQAIKPAKETANEVQPHLILWLALPLKKINMLLHFKENIFQD